MCAHTFTHSEKRRTKVNRNGKVGTTQWREPVIERETALPYMIGGRGVPNNRLLGIDQPKRLLIQLGALPCLQIASHVAHRSKVTERCKGVHAVRGSMCYPLNLSRVLMYTATVLDTLTLCERDVRCSLHFSLMQVTHLHLKILRVTNGYMQI